MDNPVPVPIPIQLNLVSGIYIIAQNPVEPYLLPGVKVVEIKELKKEPKTINLLGFKVKVGKKNHVHSYEESFVEVAGTRMPFRYCNTRFDIAHIFNPNTRNFVRYKIFKTTGGKTYNVKPSPEPGEIEPR